MHIYLPTNENATEVSKPFKEHYETLSSRATVNYGSTQNTTVSPSVFIPINYTTAKTLPPIRTLPTPTRGSWEVFNSKPEIEHWPPLPENPESTNHSYNPLHVGILGGVLIVVFFWVIVIGVVLRNKIQSRRQRRRAEQPPSHVDLQYTSNSALYPSDSSNMEPSPRLPEPTEPIILDIETPVENSPSFTLYQPSAPNVTTQNSTNEEPPSYAESQNSNMMRSRWDQPPSYVEAQQQNAKNARAN